MSIFSPIKLFFSRHLRIILIVLGVTAVIGGGFFIKGCVSDHNSTKAQLATTQAALTLAQETVAREMKARAEAELRAKRMEQDFSIARKNLEQNKEKIASIATTEKEDPAKAFAEVNAHLARLFNEAENLFPGS